MFSRRNASVSGHHVSIVSASVTISGRFGEQGAPGDEAVLGVADHVPGRGGGGPGRAVLVGVLWRCRRPGSARTHHRRTRRSHCGEPGRGEAFLGGGQSAPVGPLGVHEPAAAVAVVPGDPSAGLGQHLIGEAVQVEVIDHDRRVGQRLAHGAGVGGAGVDRHDLDSVPPCLLARVEPGADRLGRRAARREAEDRPTRGRAEVGQTRHPRLFPPPRPSHGTLVPARPSGAGLINAEPAHRRRLDRQRRGGAGGDVVDQPPRHPILGRHLRIGGGSSLLLYEFAAAIDHNSVVVPIGKWQAVMRHPAAEPSGHRCTGRGNSVMQASRPPFARGPFGHLGWKGHPDGG